MIRKCSLKTITFAILAVAFVGGCEKRQNNQLDSDLNQARAAMHSFGDGFAATTTGSIPITEDIPEIVTDTFTCTPLYPLKRGDKRAAKMSGAGAWSIDTCSVQAGTQKVCLPIFAMVKSHVVFPATLKMKKDIAAGGMVSSSGYTILAIRAVKANEPIAALDVGDGIFAVETAKDAANNADELPAVAVFKNGLNLQDRIAACEAWLTVRSAGN